MSRVGLRRVLSTCILALAVSSLRAQNVTGSITGEVKDGTGAVVTGAVVTARNAGTSAVFAGKTDETGAYWLRNLPVGVYVVSAEATGFSRFETAGLRLQVNEVIRLDMALAVGSTTDSVTVGAQAI